MKFETTAGELLKPLAAVCGAIETNKTLPILTHAALRARDGRLELIGSNLETEIETALPLTGFEPGAITVPGRRLLDIVRSFEPSERVSARWEAAGEAGQLRLTIGRGRYLLNTLPVENFPLFDLDRTEIGRVTLDAAPLARLIDKTGYAMAVADVRFYLNGLMLQVDGATLRAVASDGHRMAIAECPVEGGFERQSLVPRRAILELLKLLKGAHSVALRIAETQITATIDGLRWSAKLIEGRFPDYQRVLPRDLTRRVTVARAALLQALGRAVQIQSGNFRSVKIDWEEGALRIRSANAEGEQVTETVPAELDGAAFEIAFDGDYLIDALAHLDGERAVIELTDGCNSSLVTDPGESGYRFVVMPMRL